MPYGQVDRIAKMIPSNPANPVTLQEALDQDPDLRLEMKREATTERLIEIALRLEGLYRHASTHAAGVVIGDRPLQELVPLYRDQKSSMPVTQFNMKYVEQAGLVKFDFLGLKTMTVIQKTVDMIRDSGGADIDILRIPFDDEKTYELMTRGQTVGVFQLESTGMRDTLRRMRPNRLEDIIALVSLYRPGPMDNIPTYVARKDGREEPDYMHPILRPYLEETYGIMIYQEQVMQAAQALAGYTLGGADLLRRAMGKKIKEEMDAQRALFAKGAADTHQVPPAKAEEIFEQINKFAGYGFNKSHAAAYAAISYWTGWLKANYPLEFMAASMTLDKGNTDKLSVFRQDLVKMEIPLLIPDLNKSDVDFVVEGDGVRYALSALKSVGEQAMVTLCTIRAEKGVYKNIQDFASRIGSGVLNKRQIEALAAAGAFESLGYHRAEVYNEAEKVLRYAQEKAIERESGQVSLFGIAEDEVDSGLGLNLSAAAKWDALDQLKHEFDAVGFYLSAHPLDGKMEMLKARKMILYSDMVDTLNDKPAAYFTMAGVLMKKQIKMSKQGKKFAFLQFSDPSAVYELMVFSEILAGIQDDLQIGNAFTLKVLGEVKDDQIRLTAQSMNLLKDTTDSEKSARIKRIDIQLNHVKGAHYLKQYLLDQTGEAKIPVHLSYPLNGDSVMIALPPHYVIKDANIMPLQSHPHIVQVDVVYV
jgi:DNA polymerase-3 subunit alpha